MTNDEPGAELDGAKLAAARLWATNQHPYLASAIFACPVSPTPDLGRVVVDRWWRIHADPQVVEGATVPELGGELLHLALHLVRDHAGRAVEVGLNEPAELHHWVDAADAEIHDDLPPDLERVAIAIAANDLGAADGRLAEEYYRSGQVREGETNDCGSGAHGWAPSWEPPPPDAANKTGIGEDEQELLRRRVASDIADAQAGAVTASLRAWADRQLNPTIDWRAELAAVLRRSVSVVSGAVDYSYRRPSRRSASVAGIVLPSLHRPTVEVAVVCDTSASVDEELLAEAVGEIDGLLQATGTRSVRLLSVDDAVQTVERVTTARDIQLVGGGGTDMAVGIDAACDHRPAPHVIVVLTDGFTPWPTVGPARTDVIVALLDTNIGVAPPDPPTWVRTVRIGES